MKLTRADLEHIVTELSAVVTEEECPLKDLFYFLKSELADVTEAEPDTIELYFANSFRLPGPSRPNPFKLGRR